MPEERPPVRKELLDLLVTHLVDFAIVLCDREGNFTTWHPGVEQQFGYAKNEFIGLNIGQLYPLRDRLEGVPQRELETAAATGRASDARWLQKKDGELIFVDGVTLALRDDAGNLLGFGKVLRDITSNRTIEENLRSLASALEQSTVFLSDWDGKIEHWTAGCQQLYGWTAQEAVGRYSHVLLQTKHPCPVEEIQRELLASGAWQGELQQVRRDGSQVFVSAHWMLMADTAERRAIICTHTDVSQRVQAQRQLEAVNQRLKMATLELERSNEELEEFARIVSHDLSSPITSTRWLVDLLRTRHSSHLDADGQKCLKQIGEGLSRMSDLIDAVLAHAVAGTTSVTSYDPVSAAEAFEAACDNLQRHIKTSNAAIEPPGPLPHLYVELQPLTQVFQNLLSNAIKYAKSNVPPSIRITAQRDGSMWLIGVHDNGIGIAPEWFERIFQPMQRRHGLEIAGSGIGLATCKKIILRAGGRIWVESQEGVGSSFFFSVPGPAERPPAGSGPA